MRIEALYLVMRGVTEEKNVYWNQSGILKNFWAVGLLFMLQKRYMSPFDFWLSSWTNSYSTYVDFPNFHGVPFASYLGFSLRGSTVVTLPLKLNPVHVFVWNGIFRYSSLAVWSPRDRAIFYIFYIPRCQSSYLYWSTVISLQRQIDIWYEIILKHGRILTKITHQR